MNKNIIGLIALSIFVGLLLFFLKPQSNNDNATQPLSDSSEIKSNQIEGEQEMNLNQNNIESLSKPELTIDTAKSYTASMVTDKGTMTIELFADKTPITVNNFVYLAEQGYYDNTFFHRVIEDFMIQGGDPTGTGAGGPGYRFDDEPFEGEYSRGTLAMANAGPNTNGSQFFIIHNDYPLPTNYVIFGRLVDGLDVLDAIATSEVSLSSSGEMSKPVTPTYIKSINIESK